MTVSAEDNNKSLEYENETFLESLNRWRKNMLWSRFFMYTIWVSIALYGFLTFPYKTHKLTFIWCMCFKIIIKISILIETFYFLIFSNFFNFYNSFLDFSILFQIISLKNIKIYVTK